MDLSKHSVDIQTKLSSVYVIHGEEDLLRIEATDALRLAAKQQGYCERMAFTVDAQFDWSEIETALDSPGLFAELRLIEVHIPTGKPGKRGADALFQLAQKTMVDAILLIILPKLEKVQLSSKWFTALNKSAQVLEAKAIQAAHLPAWVRQRLMAQGLEIESEALAQFAEKVEGNLLAAKQEVDKLALLLPSGSLITMDHIHNAIANVARFDVFQLSAAWMSGDTQRLNNLLETLQADGEEPILLLWAVSEDIRTLLRLEGALKQGQSVGQVRNSLRLWGEKQQLAPRALKRIGAKKLIWALQKCAEIDRQIKGAAEGNAWISAENVLFFLAA